MSSGVVYHMEQYPGNEEPTAQALARALGGKRNGTGSMARRRAHDDHADLFGPGKPQLILNSSEIGRRCRSCGAETFVTGRGAGPHAARLICIACGSFNGWLPRAQAEALLRRAG